MIREDGDGWWFGGGFDRHADFCVWVLEQDGLRVPLFDRHPEGDGRLRAAGLDADSWRRWLAAAVANGREADRILAAARPPNWNATRALRRPELAWRGNPRVGTLLVDLAAAHTRDAFDARKEAALDRQPNRATRDGLIAQAVAFLARRRSPAADPKAPNDADSDADADAGAPGSDRAPAPPFDALWRAFLPYHAAIPAPLSLAFVAYSGPVRLALPPSTLMLGMVGWRPDRAGYVREIVAGADELAALNS
jgi:hypothetical protein